MRRFFSILIILLLLALPAYKAYSLFLRPPVTQPAAASADGVEAVRALEAVDKAELESSIAVIRAENAEKEALRVLREERQQGTEKILKQLEDGVITYNGIFADTLIVGDSLMKGLSAYNILSEDIVLGQVSATLYHLQDNVSNIIYAAPRRVLLHYGENHIGSSSQASVDSFIGFYSELINKLKAGLPETEFYVSGIFPASAEGIRKQSFLGNVPLYNDALKKMCEELEVNYIDNTAVLPGDNSYYGSDGIHVQPSFYREVWLPYVIYVLGL